MALPSTNFVITAQILTRSIRNPVKNKKKMDVQYSRMVLQDSITAILLTSGNASVPTANCLIADAV
jgi:hypothetical protein